MSDREVDETKDSSEEESTSRAEELKWVASTLVENANKLSEMYQTSMTLEGKSVTLESEELAGIINQLCYHSRDLLQFLGRMEYDQILEHQRTHTVVGKTNFKTPANWGSTVLTEDNFDATLAEVRAIKAVPLTRDFWPQPVNHVESTEIGIVPAPSPPSLWKRLLYFLGFSVPEITDNRPKATL
jgi:hypothetical protein